MAIGGSEFYKKAADMPKEEQDGFICYYELAADMSLPIEDLESFQHERQLYFEIILIKSNESSLGDGL